MDLKVLVDGGWMVEVLLCSYLFFVYLRYSVEMGVGCGGVWGGRRVGKYLIIRKYFIVVG